ncbi:hypothetical protein ARMGADRAFT_1090699 [Armillaria gallica]|uniref:Uncharacterized protein n=1 Tax=Armillaria gallica TaxID=47427 RepID=A0A2H3CG15_ARMGA|nr:hypothetical protein ARMGADRAFT_1090699 [Armillaria gallica]
MNETAGTSLHTPTAGPSNYAAIPDKDEQVASPPPISVIPEGCPKQNIILPKHLHDLLPSKPTGFRLFASLEQKPPPLPAIPQQSPSRSPSPSASQPPKPVYLETAPNEMGLYRCYKKWPTIDPTMGGGLDEVSDASTFTLHADHLTNTPEGSTDPFYPFQNATIFWLFAWFYQPTSKSLSDAPDFDPKHLTDNFDAAKEIKVLDTIGKQQNHLLFSLSDGWHETSVTIKLPQTGVEHMSEESASKFKSTAFLDFHLKGFKEMWDPRNGDQPEWVYGEVYSSDIFLEIEDEISLMPDLNGLETVVVPCMLYSDSTHFTNFGTAVLWPIYLLFGLLSKYVQAQPTSGASHHIVYMPTIPDKIQDAYLKYFGQCASPAILTFLKWELFHAIWEKLLSLEFMDAYINRVVILYADNIYHHVYPHFFVYSADYPKKVLLGFSRKLKDHLLSQILDSNDEFMDLYCQNLIIVDNHLYSHQILRINYTIYDARRNQDFINPRTHSDIMALSPFMQADLDSDNDAHPYLYARVIGIFHVMRTFSFYGSNANTLEAAESDAEEEDDMELSASTSKLGHVPADLADSDNSDAESNGSIEDEDSDSSWQSDDYVELNEPKEDDEFDDDGLFGYSAL